MSKVIGIVAACGLASVAIAGAPPVTAFDQNVTPGVIFGSGNANGSYTTATAGDIEVGLRGKLRYNAMGLPENTFNSNGDGTYNFNPGGSHPTRPEWNFEWSINVNAGGTGLGHLDGYTYLLGLDADPSAGTNYLTFDPINSINPNNGQVWWDHSMGNNSTTAATDVIAGSAAAYATNLGQYNVAQNSWNYGFFPVGPLAGFDRNTPGQYSIFLAVYEGSSEIARSSIVINVVPAPGAMALVGLGGLVATRRRR